MAGIACVARPSPITPRSTTKARRRRCCRSMKSMSEEGSTGPAPKLIKLAVSGVTEILGVLSPVKDDSLESVSDDERDGVPASCVDDVVMIIASDYEKAYFVTDVRFKAGSVEPAHHHTFGHDVVVLEGRKTVWNLTKKERYDLVVGDYLFTPRGDVHRVQYHEDTEFFIKWDGHWDMFFDEDLETAKKAVEEE